MFGQNITFSGKVTRAESGEVLIGASVSVKGTTRGTITDISGKYKLNAKGEDVVLIAKYIGFKDREIAVKVNGRDKINVDFAMVSNDTQLQDIIVTANKTEEYLQKVNVAATVISSKDIEQRTSYSTLDALKDAPLVLTDSWIASQTSFSIRGLANNFDNVGFESTVGLYIDDVYFSRGFAFNSALFDIDRIEVLRGPQGTLFGKNTIGGVVNVISEKPEWANNGQGEIVYGNYNYLQLRGKWNYELIKNKLSMRLTGALTRRNGYIKDPNPAINASNGNNYNGLRGTIFYNPNDKTDITFKAYYGRDNKTEQTMIYLSGQGENPLGVPASDIDTYSANTPQTFYRNQSGGMLRLNRKVGENTFTSISAFNSSEDFVKQDFDETIVDVSRWGRKQGLKNFSQEFRLASPRSDDRTISYVGGLYFLSERIKGLDTSSINEGFIPFARKYLNSKVPDIKGFQETYDVHSDIQSVSFAAFGSGSYKLSEKLKINAGLRFTSEARKFSFYENIGYFIYNGKPVKLMDTYAAQVGSAQNPLTRQTNDNVLTYDISLDYKVNPYVLTYVKYVKGFKGTGFNTSVTRDVTGSALVFKPEYVTSFEAGFKSKFSNRMKLNAAVFYNNYLNKQEFLDQGETVTIVNADKTGGMGAEAEFSAMLKGFRFDISGGLIDMKYKKFIFGKDENGELIDFSGNKLLKAPNVTLSVAPSYTYNLIDKYKLLFGLSINHVGKAYNDISNSEIIARQPSTIINSRVSLMPKNGKWSIALWGKNLGNQIYYQHGWEYIWGSQASLSRPRTYGIEMYLNFF
ncbi:TonB-dependent receptor [Emticicia aquatilis]|uniref:TonB-dependent receptor n=2 Tax=Emticicia aquatilis TaxID=1537369 RepID=A0A916YYS1_9BACT|nr:TonB-dependent receptor [Emticicia aquatilis]